MFPFRKKADPYSDTATPDAPTYYLIRKTMDDVVRGHQAQLNDRDERIAALEMELEQKRHIDDAVVDAVEKIVAALNKEPSTETKGEDGEV